MSSITTITPEFSAAPQIGAEDVAELAALGYRSIICNRPDDEDAGQPPVAEIRAAAERQGLGFAFVPVVSGRIDEDDVADFRAALADLPAPVLAYCRSGTRSRNLWLLAQR
jgi:sulfide:quinone oxidoreductase